MHKIYCFFVTWHLFLMESLIKLFINSMNFLFTSLIVTCFLLIYTTKCSIPYIPNMHQTLQISQRLRSLNLSQIYHSLINHLTTNPNLFNKSTNTPLSECLNKIANMSNNFLTDQAVLNFALYSGKGIGDIGDYDSCHDTTESYYIIFTLQVNDVVGVRSAFCIPRACKPEVLDLTRPFLASFLGGFVNMTLTKNQIVFEYPKQENIILNQMKPGGKLFMGGSIVLILFILVITCLDRYKYFEKQGKQKTTLKRVLVCFSLQRTFSSLFKSENKLDPKLEVFNGIRLFSIMWIILGHYFVALLLSPVFNFLEVVNDIFHTFYMGFIKAANLSSDTFFFMSGFFAALSLYRIFINSENRNVKTFIWAYVHRYIRLFPNLIFGLLGTTFILPTLYDSPMSSWAGPQVKLCEDQWQYCLSYVNNFMSSFYGACMAWLWYLQNDCQLFCTAPIIIFLYCYRKSYGLLSLGFLSLVSLVVQTIIIVHYKFTLSVTKLDMTYDLNTYTFIKPYCRALTYFMGILTFLMYEEAKNPEKGVSVFCKVKQIFTEFNVMRRILYFMGIFVMFMSIWSFYWLDEYPDSWNTTFGNIHMVLVRPVFIIGVWLIVYPVLIGKGRLILNTLGHYIFSPISKLTYGVYILHLPLIGVARFMTVQGRFARVEDCIIAMIGITFMSYIFSLATTIIYEYPTLKLVNEFIEYKIVKLYYKENNGEYQPLESEQKNEEKTLKIEENKID